MNNLLKALIVWLMLVAIPFQGFATASMLPCAPGQAAPAMAPEHCAMMATMMPAHAHVQAQEHAASAHAAAHDHAGGKCSACASCCFGAVMAPPMPAVQAPLATPALAVHHRADGPVAAVDLALPERPPKFSLT